MSRVWGFSYLNCYKKNLESICCPSYEMNAGSWQAWVSAFINLVPRAFPLKVGGAGKGPGIGWSRVHLKPWNPGCNKLARFAYLKVAKSRWRKFVYWKVSRGLKCVRTSTTEICQSQWVERQQYLCLSVNIQSTSLEVALNKTTESYSD